jgi:hypothetical protein
MQRFFQFTYLQPLFCNARIVAWTTDVADCVCLYCSMLEQNSLDKSYTEETSFTKQVACIQFHETGCMHSVSCKQFLAVHTEESTVYQVSFQVLKAASMKMTAL